MPSWDDRTSPRDVARSGLCIGCGACAGRAGGEMAFDRYGQLKPVGDWQRQPDPALQHICPFSARAADEDELAAAVFPTAGEHDARLGRFEAAYVGAVAEGEFRAKGSSGGMVSWVAGQLLRRGLVDGVAHVAPGAGGRFFTYRIARSEGELAEGAKSRYYPVEMSGVLAEIMARPGRYAVIGVPCFIKAVQLLRRHDPVLRERIAFTLGLFCGHGKSARLVESFAWQLGTSVEAIARPEFRLKDPDRPANWYTAHLTLRDGTTRQQDWWHLADGDWGAGFFQNSACNFCDDVVAETADIAFGDAWVEPYSSDGRGTNVVLVRTPLLAALVQEGIAAGRLELTPVGADFVAATQAAGLRQRREGLAYRLTWTRRGLPVRKRVEASRAIPMQRKLIYRLRHGISAWSHRVFLAARTLRLPAIYVGWARCALGLYAGVTYGRGRLGAIVRWAGPAGSSR